MIFILHKVNAHSPEALKQEVTRCPLRSPPRVCRSQLWRQKAAGPREAAGPPCSSQQLGLSRPLFSDENQLTYLVATSVCKEETTLSFRSRSGFVNGARFKGGSGTRQT